MGSLGFIPQCEALDFLARSQILERATCAGPCCAACVFLRDGERLSEQLWRRRRCDVFLPVPNTTTAIYCEP